MICLIHFAVVTICINVSFHQNVDFDCRPNLLFPIGQHMPITLKFLLDELRTEGPQPDLVLHEKICTGTFCFVEALDYTELKP